MRKAYKGWVLLMLISLLAGCISIPIGDGQSMKLSKDGVKIKSKDGENQEISFETDDEDAGFTISGEGEDGEETSMSVGQTKEVPEEFPKEIPLPDGAEIASAMNMNLGDMVQIMIYFEADISKMNEYLEMYKEFGEKNGYEKVYETTADDYVDLELQKGNETVSFTANLTGQDDHLLNVALTYRETTEEEE